MIRLPDWAERDLDSNLHLSYDAYLVTFAQALSLPATTVKVR